MLNSNSNSWKHYDVMKMREILDFMCVTSLIVNNNKTKVVHFFYTPDIMWPQTLYQNINFIFHSRCLCRVSRNTGMTEMPKSWNVPVLPKWLWLVLKSRNARVVEVMMIIYQAFRFFDLVKTRLNLLIGVYWAFRFWLRIYLCL